MNMKSAVLALTLAGGLLLSSALGRAQMLRPAPSSQGLTLSGVAVQSSASAILKTYGRPTVLVSQGKNTSSVQKRLAGVPLLAPDNLPVWAKSVAPQLNATDVLWLYKSSSYVLAFRVDSLNLVNAVLVAGTNATSIAATRLVIPEGNIAIGDDLRKTVRGLGFPSDIQPFGKNETGSTRGYVLIYDLDDSLAFTVSNNHVVRIVLWKNPAQPKLRYLNHNAF